MPVPLLAARYSSTSLLVPSYCELYFCCWHSGSMGSCCILVLFQTLGLREGQVEHAHRVCVCGCESLSPSANTVVQLRQGGGWRRLAVGIVMYNVFFRMKQERAVVRCRNQEINKCQNFEKQSDNRSPILQTPSNMKRNWFIRCQENSSLRRWHGCVP